MEKRQNHRVQSVGFRALETAHNGVPDRLGHLPVTYTLNTRVHGGSMYSQAKASESEPCSA